MPGQQGAIRLFRLLGIDVFLHWSWFVVAVLELQSRSGEYASPVWNVLEYLALFLIVLLHEFGHSLACRQTGGSAEHIVLWPLGGVAYVNPPQRPGATLWSLAAGPLVNVALVPILLGLGWAGARLGWSRTHPDLLGLVHAVFFVNVVILIFNLLPVYPLDGGKILRSLLWFAIGKARSLLAATLVGFLGVLGLGWLAFRLESGWLGILTVFVALNCWNGFKQARALLELARLPRRSGLRCPSCGVAPPAGAVWGCAQCKRPFDPFETRCPWCGDEPGGARCVDCGAFSPLAAWGGAGEGPPPRAGG